MYVSLTTVPLPSLLRFQCPLQVEIPRESLVGKGRLHTELICGAATLLPTQDYSRDSEEERAAGLLSLTSALQPLPGAGGWGD